MPSDQMIFWLPVGIVFVLGLFIGSFLNVCIYRMPLEKSVIKPRSFCPGCGKTLSPRDLLPVLSYLLAGRKCRYCRQPISPRYMTVELLTGVSYAVLYAVFGPVPEFLMYSVLVSLLIVAFFVDLDHQIIPDQVSIGGMVVAAAGDIILLSLGWSRPVVDIALGAYSITIPGSLIGIVGGFVSFYVIAVAAEAVFKAEALGGGDIKLAGAIGGFLGLKLAGISFVLAFIVGAAGGIILLASKIKSRKDYIPFGPYMVIGAIVALFYGNRIIDWYMALIHG